MRYIFLSLLVSLLVSCEQSKEISEKEVMETFNEFFYLLDNDIDKNVTPSRVGISSSNSPVCSRLI